MQARKYVNRFDLHFLINVLLLQDFQGIYREKDAKLIAVGERVEQLIKEFDPLALIHHPDNHTRSLMSYEAKPVIEALLSEDLLKNLLAPRPHP